MNRELIAEAREWLKSAWPEDCHRTAVANVACEEAECLVKCLAAALEAMELPEGWRPIVYEHTDGLCIEEGNTDQWWIATDAGTDTSKTFPTAREAMAALDATPPA